MKVDIYLKEVSPRKWRFETVQDWIQDRVNKESLIDYPIPDGELRPDDHKESPFQWTPTALAAMVGNFIKANLP